MTKHTPPGPGLRDRSLADLEGLQVDPGAYELGSQAWLARALVSPIGQLGIADLRLLVAHGRGLAHLMPLVLETLERAPFAAGDHGPGELLTAACIVDEAWWVQHPAQQERLRSILRDARAQLGTLDDAARAHWVDELDAADGKFRP